MKYFTKEELEDITKELIENPTRETLKSLNDKYNSENVEEIVSTPKEIVEIPVVQQIPQELPQVINEVEEKMISPVNVVEPQMIVQQPNINMPNLELPIVDSNSVNNVMPSFEVPKLETPVVNNQNNQPINFNGNIFDTQNTNIGNLMQTTDNFNSVPNTMPNTEINLSPQPFFSASQEVVNNPIPVNGPININTNQMPSMFGQFEKNNM